MQLESSDWKLRLNYCSGYPHVAHVPTAASSEVVLHERQGGQHLHVFWGGGHSLHRFGALRNSLANELFAFELRLLLLLVIVLDAMQESLVTAGLAHVLDPHVDPLPKLAIANDLGNLDAEGIAIHVEDNAGSAMVQGVRQGLSEWMDLPRCPRSHHA